LSRTDDTAEEVCLLPLEKFRTEVYLPVIDQSINTNLYSAPLARGTLDPGQRKWTVFKSCWNREHL